MARTIGRNSRIAVSTDGVTYYDIGRLTGGSFNPSQDRADGSSNDSNGFDEGDYSQRRVAISADFYYDKSGQAQDILLQELDNLSKIYLRFRPSETSGEYSWTALYTLEDFSIDPTYNENITGSISATSDGTVTRATQP